MLNETLIYIYVAAVVFTLGRVLTRGCFSFRSVERFPGGGGGGAGGPGGGTEGAGEPQDSGTTETLGVRVVHLLQ